MYAYMHQYMDRCKINIMPLALAIGGRGMKTEDTITSTVTGHIKNVSILSEHNI